MPIVLNMQTLAVSLLAATALGGVAWVFIYPHLSGERHVEQRRDLVARSEPIRREGRSARPQKSRRDQVEESLKELEQRNKKSKKPSLSVRIAQAGLTWSKQRFFVTGGILGLLLFIMPLGFGFGLLPALAFGFAGAAGLPFWILSFLKKRREAKFLEHFPDAVDVIVRGIKSGLPLLDCMKLISVEAQEPVRTEFRLILDIQSVGLPLGEACAKLYDRIPLPEANFFGIVITIQQKAGGNLSEALGNLSRVLRDRKKMKAKIQAMSMEAKASAGIIGVLPIAVMTLIYITSPDYISLLFKEQLGHMMLAACGLWMCVGVFVMRKMIQFDF
jgi:tight adherence protein B